MISNKMTRLADLLERHEGRRKRLYVDTVGKLTIGVGRNMTDGKLGEDEINLMLANDLRRAMGYCRRLFPTWMQLSPPRQAVLIDMMFMGPGRVRGFRKMRAALSRGDFKETAVQMLDSKWARQVGKKPRQRAWRLARMMVRDEWPTS